MHRDLSYGNILVDAQGRARLIDFEFAKLCAHKDEPEFRVVCTHTGRRVLSVYLTRLVSSRTGYFFVHGR